MSHLTRKFVIGVATLTALLGCQGAVAEEDAARVSATPAPAPVSVIAHQAKVGIAWKEANALGVVPLDLKALANKRGGSDVFNDMQLKGVVAGNRAINVSTGNNAITGGAFAGAAGLPMVVQNSGNNVLIQNATIVNVQVK